MINYDVPLNARGNNVKLRGNVLDDVTMKANGFVQRYGRWILYEILGNNVSLNINVFCDVLLIDVFDEQFLQPYDYQWILRNNPESGIPLKIHSKVQATMKRLSDAGIIEGWVANDYI